VEVSAHHGSGVGEHGDRGTLRVEAGLTVGLATDHDNGAVLVDERVVEQAKGELLREKPPHRHVQARLRDGAVVDQPDEQLGAHLATELVDPCLKRHADPLGSREMLDAPGTRRQRRAEDVGIGDETPIGADDPREPELVAQQAGDDGPVEPEPDLLVLGADRHAGIICAVPASIAARNGARCSSNRPPGYTCSRPYAKCGSSPSFCGPPPGKCLVIAVLAVAGDLWPRSDRRTWSGASPRWCVLST